MLETTCRTPVVETAPAATSETKGVAMAACGGVGGRAGGGCTGVVKGGTRKRFFKMVVEGRVALAQRKGSVDACVGLEAGACSR